MEITNLPNTINPTAATMPATKMKPKSLFALSPEMSLSFASEMLETPAEMMATTAPTLSHTTLSLQSRPSPPPSPNQQPTTPTTPRTATHTPRELPTMYILDAYDDDEGGDESGDYMNSHNSNNISTPTEEPEANASLELEPCPVCRRTFNPVTLKKHVGICEKMTTKRRNVFDSSRQRREGTELAAYPLPKNFGLPDKPSHTSNTSIATTVAKAMERCNSPKRVARVASPVLPRKKSEDEIIRSTARASMRKGANASTTNNNTTTTAPVPIPGSFVRDRRRSSERSLTRRGIQPPPAEQCPHCERCFGIKAYDRHVEWCKEKALQATIKQISTKVEENIAKARLEARTKYKAPCLKSKRTVNREKYAGFNGEEATNDTNDSPKSLDRNGANDVNAAEITANSNSEHLMVKSMTSSMASESTSNRKFQNPSGNCNEATNLIRIRSREKSTIPQHKHYNKQQEQEEENGAVVQETVANFQFEMPDFHQHLNEQNKKSKVKLTKSKQKLSTATTAIATSQTSSVSGLNALKSKLFALKCEEKLEVDNNVNNDYVGKKEYGNVPLGTLCENKTHYKDGEGTEGDEQYNLPTEDLNISTGLTLYAKKKPYSDETCTSEEKPSILKNTITNIKMTMEEFFDKDDFLENEFIPSRTPSPKKSIHFKDTEKLNVFKVLGKSGNKSDIAALHPNREEETDVENIDQSPFPDHMLMGSPSPKKTIRQSSLTRPKTPRVARDNQEYTDENDGIRVIKLPTPHMSRGPSAEDVRSFSPSKKQIDQTFLIETDVTQVVSKLSTPEMSRHASTEDVQLCSPSKKSSFSQAGKTFILENKPTQSTEFQSNASPTKSHRSIRQFTQEKSSIQLNKSCESSYADKDESSLLPMKNYKPSNDFVEFKIPGKGKQLTENKNEFSDYEENRASYHPNCVDDNVKRSDSRSSFVIQKGERRTNDEENQSPQYMKTPRTPRCGTMERDYPDHQLRSPTKRDFGSSPEKKCRFQRNDFQTTPEKQENQNYHYIKTPRTSRCSAVETEYKDQHLSSPAKKDFGSSPEKIPKYQKARNDTQTKLSARSKTVNKPSYSEEPANSKKQGRLHRSIKETSQMVSSSSDSENSKEQTVKRKQLTRNCTSSSPHKKITSEKSKQINLLETQSSKERRTNYKSSSSERHTESSKVDLQKSQSKMTFVISNMEERDKSNASIQRSESECSLSEKEERAKYYNAPPKTHRAIIKGVDSKESFSEKAVNLSIKRSAPSHTENNFTEDNCSPIKPLPSTLNKEERKRGKLVSRKIDFGDDSLCEHEDNSPIKRRQLRKEGSPNIQVNSTEKGEHFTENVVCAPCQLKGRANSLERTKLQNEKVHNNEMRKTESVESLSEKSKQLNLLETQSSKERRTNYKSISSERHTESSKVDLQKSQSKMTFVISNMEERDKSNASIQRSESECSLSEKEERAKYYNALAKTHRAIIKGVDSKENLSEKAVNLSSKRSAPEVMKKIPQPLQTDSNFTEDNCSPTKPLRSTFKKEERKRGKLVSRKIDFGDDSPCEHEDSSPIKRRQLRKEGSPNIQMNSTEKGEHFTENVACAPCQPKGRADNIERIKLQNEKVYNNQIRKTESVESLSENISRVSCKGKGRIDNRERSQSQNDRGPKYQMHRVKSGENLSGNQPKGRDYSQERSKLINERSPRCQMRRTESGESLSEVVARAPCQLKMRSESQGRANKQRTNVETNAEKKMLPKRSFSETAASLNKVKTNHSEVKRKIYEDLQTSDTDEDEHIVIRYPPMDKNQTEEESMDFETSLKALNSTEEIRSLIPNFRKCSPPKKLNRSLKESFIENKHKTASTKKPAGRSDTPRATSKTRVVRPSTPPPPPPKNKIPSNTNLPSTPPLTPNTSSTLLSGQTKLETSPKKSLTLYRPTRKKLAIRSSVSSTTSLPMKAMPIKSMEVYSATLAPHIKNTICQNRITDDDNLDNIDNTENYMEDRVAERDPLEIKVIKEPPKLRRDESFTLSDLPDNYDPFVSAKRQLEELLSPSADAQSTSTSTSNTQYKMTSSLTLNSTTTSTVNNPSHQHLQIPKTPTLTRSLSFRRTASLRGPKRSPLFSSRPPLFAQKHKPTIQRGISDEGPISTNFIKPEEFDEMPVRSVCVNDYAVTKSPRIVRRDTSNLTRKQPLKLNINVESNDAHNSSNMLSSTPLKDGSPNTTSKYICKTDSLAVFLKYEHELEKLNKSDSIMTKDENKPPTQTTLAKVGGPFNSKELKDKSNALSKQNSAKSIKADSLERDELPKISQPLTKSNSGSRNQYNTKSQNKVKSQVRLLPLKCSTPLTKPSTSLTKSSKVLLPLEYNKSVALNNIFGDDHKTTNNPSDPLADYIDPKLINKCDNLPINIAIMHSKEKPSQDSDSSEPRTDNMSSSSSESAAMVKSTTKKLQPLIKTDPSKEGIGTTLKQNSIKSSARQLSENRSCLKRRMRLGKNQFLYDASPETDSCSADDEWNRSSLEFDDKPKTFEQSVDMPAFDEFDFEEFLSSIEHDEDQYPLFKDCKEFLMNRAPKKQKHVDTVMSKKPDEQKYHKNTHHNTFPPLTPTSNHIQFPPVNSLLKSSYPYSCSYHRTSKKIDSNTPGGNLKTVNPSTSQETPDNGQKREIFISIETEQNDLDRAALSPNALRNMVGNTQTVVEVEMDAHDNKFSKISDDDMPANSISRNSSQTYMTNSNHLPNVQINNAKNLKQKMSNEEETDSKHADNCGATVAAAAAAARSTRKVSKANKATATPSGDAYADSDELSSLDGYPLSSPNSTRAVSSKTSADSAYGSLSRQRSSESTSTQHPTFNSRTRIIGNSMRPMAEECANALPTNSCGNVVTTRPSQLSASSNSSSEHTLPPIGGYNNNAHNNTNNNYTLQQLYPPLNNNDLNDDERNNNNNFDVAVHPSTTMPTPAVVHHSGLSTPLNNSSQLYNSNSTISTSMKMSKFCHECGSKFIVDQAKFCMDCGVRRIVL